MSFGTRISTTRPTTTSAPARWAMVSTYPPTPCGLATFAAALVDALTMLGAQIDVVRVLDEEQDAASRPQGAALVTGRPDSAGATASVLNGYDVVVIQHEYGIFGGADGVDVVDVMTRITVPVMTVLHTVLAAPTAHQRSVLQSVVAASDVLVTMTKTARHRVIESYGAHPERVVVIPHGAAEALVSGARPARRAGVLAGTEPVPAVEHRLDETCDTVGAEAKGRRPVILTWGLLGVGKGIEWAIEALAQLQDLTPRPLYVVAGRTHPRVLEHEGERYRQMLMHKACALDVADDVVFDDRYLDAAALHRLVRAADIVLLPYDSREQVTSGVLIEAVAAGRPVVSSRFPHAVELLEAGAGLLVDQRDPAGISAALRRLLTEPGLAARVSRKAEALAPELSWLSVAGRYLAIGKGLTRRRGVAARPSRDPHLRAPATVNATVTTADVAVVA